MHECLGQVWVTVQEREGELLCSPWIMLAWTWDRPGAFSKWPINFPNFHVLWMGPSPNQSLLSSGKTDRPLWPSTSPCAILTSVLCGLAFLCSHLAIWYLRGGWGGREDCSSSWQSTVLCSPGVWRWIFLASELAYAFQFIQLNVEFPLLSFLANYHW